MDSLPREVLNIIFAQLDQSMLIIIFAVSHKWNEIIAHRIHEIYNIYLLNYAARYGYIKILDEYTGQILSREQTTEILSGALEGDCVETIEYMRERIDPFIYNEFITARFWNNFITMHINIPIRLRVNQGGHIGTVSYLSVPPYVCHRDSFKILKLFEEIYKTHAYGDERIMYRTLILCPKRYSIEQITQNI